jgi:hypothetical protein
MITVICGAAVLLILEILKPRFAAGLYRTTLAAR